MEILARLNGFEWDVGNDTKNQKHGVSTTEAEQLFFNEPLLILDDTGHSVDELRYHALGITSDNRLLHVTFTVRNTKIRVISARDMHRKERAFYEQSI